MLEAIHDHILFAPLHVEASTGLTMAVPCILLSCPEVSGALETFLPLGVRDLACSFRLRSSPEYAAAAHRNIMRPLGHHMHTRSQTSAETSPTGNGSLKVSHAGTASTLIKRRSHPGRSGITLGPGITFGWARCFCPAEGDGSQKPLNR